MIPSPTPEQLTEAIRGLYLIDPKLFSAVPWQTVFRAFAEDDAIIYKWSHRVRAWIAGSELTEAYMKRLGAELQETYDGEQGFTVRGCRVSDVEMGMNATPAQVIVAAFEATKGGKP